MRRPWRAGLTAGARDRAPWPLNFFFFIWDRITALFSRGREPGDDALALPRPEVEGLARRMTAWQDEMSAAFGPGPSIPGQVLAGRLDETRPLKEKLEAGAEAMVAQGLDKSRKLTRRYGWRVRHHLLPLLVLVYPLLPAAAAWLFPGQTSGTGLAVKLNVTWADVLTIVETILALYFIETLYWAFSLDRAAGRALDQLAGEWRAYLAETVQSNITAPAQDFARQLEEEIEAANSISEKTPLLLVQVSDLNQTDLNNTLY